MPCATRTPAASSRATRSATSPPPQRRGATPFRMQATALGRYLLYGPDGRMPAALRSTRSLPTTTPGPRRLAHEDAGATFGWSTSPPGSLGVGTLGPLQQVAPAPRWASCRRRAARASRRSRSTSPASRSRARARRHGCAASSTTTSTSAPSSSSAAASTADDPGAPTASRLRCATASTTTPTAPPPSWRTSSPPAARRHAQPRGLAELRRLATRRVPEPRGHLLEMDRARLAVGAAHHGQRPGGEPRALRPLPAEEEQLQRDGQRVQAGRRHARAAGLHRRPVRRPRQGLPAHRQDAGRGAQGHQRGQAGDGARHRGLRGPQLRPVQRHAEVHRRPDRRASSTSSTPPACAPCSPSTSSTTRSAAPTSTRAPPACWSTPATSTPPASSGPPTTATPPTTTTSRPTRPASTPPRSTPSSDRFWPSRCCRASCRSIRPRRCATRRASPRSAST